MLCIATKIAKDARQQARNATTAVAHRAETVRSAAKDRTQTIRERAEKVKARAVAARESVVRLKDGVQSRLVNANDKSTQNAHASTGGASSDRKFSCFAARSVSYAFHSTNSPCNNVGLASVQTLTPANSNNALVRTRIASH